MKIVNALVWEIGQPRQAYYLGTKPDGSKHYMEVKYYHRQSRKWFLAEKVKLHDGVELRYIEKKTELSNG